MSKIDRFGFLLLFSTFYAEGQSPELKIRVAQDNPVLSLDGSLGRKYIIETSPLLPSNPAAQNATAWIPGYFLSGAPGQSPIGVESSATSSRFFRAKQFNGIVDVVALTPYPLAADPGRPLALDWVFTNHIASFEQLIRLRAPGLTAPASAGLAGSASATGETFFLRNDGTWVQSETVYTNSAFGGRITNALPLAREGEWQLEFLLRDRQSRRPEQFASEHFLASLVPRIHLRVSSRFASPNKPIQVELALAGGVSPRPVKVVAWVETPDGRQLSLPSFAPGFRTLHSGTATNALFPLIGRHFTASEAGLYRVQVRMYESATDKLLARAESQFEICSGPGTTVRGRVLGSDGNPVQGGTQAAVVNALNLDEGMITATSKISSAGEYTFRFGPGRYLFSARVQDGAGVYMSTNTSLITVSCATESRNLDLKLSSVPERRAALAGITRPLALEDNAQADGLPKPRVRVMATGFISSHLCPISCAQAMQNRVLELIMPILRSDVPDVHFISDSDLNAFGQQISFGLLQGEDEAVGGTNPLESALQDLARSAGTAEFLINVAGEERSDFNSLRVLIQVVDVQSGASLRFRQFLPPVETIEQVEAAVLELIPKIILDPTDQPEVQGLFALLRGEQEKPLLPFLTLDVAPTNVPVGRTISIHGSLREKDAAGAPQTNMTLELTVYGPSFLAHSDITTGSGGSFATNLPAAIAPGIGKAQLIYRRENGREARRIEKDLRVVLPGEIALTSTRVRLRPGQSDLLSLQAGSSPSGLLPLGGQSFPGGATGRARPLAAQPAGLRVALTSTHGTLSETNVTLGTNGRADVIFTAGGVSGLAVIEATYTLTNGGPILTSQLVFSIDGSLAMTLSAAPGEVFNGVDSLLTAGVLVGGASLPALPVRFELEGSGRLAAASALTDDYGQAFTTYIAPTNGTGTVAIRAIATVGDETKTNIVSITYLPVPVCQAPTNATYTIRDLGGNFATANAINKSGQIVGSFRIGNQTHAFLYSNGTMVDLGTLGGNYSSATGINDNGQVVGTSTDGSGRERAFLYTNGTMINLGSLGGNSLAYGINSRGDVVGSSGIDATSTSTHAFVYRDGTMIDLGRLGGDGDSSASGINNNGQIVGSSFTRSNPYAFFYENGGLGGLGALVGRGSQAFAINNRGQVVGIFTISALSYHGFLYHNGSITDLGTLGGTVSTPFGINSSGHVVGHSILSGDSNVRAFVYINGAMKDLNNLIPAGSGWTLEAALGINDCGLIVGSGNIGGQGRAFLLTPVP